MHSTTCPIEITVTVVNVHPLAGSGGSSIMTKPVSVEIYGYHLLNYYLNT